MSRIPNFRSESRASHRRFPNVVSDEEPCFPDQLRSLQNQIHWHAMFNCLNTVVGLIRSNPRMAEEFLLDMACMLRVMLNTPAICTLEDEIRLAKLYLRVESRRLGKRLDARWRIDPHLDANQEIPAITLQPLLENAIHHGIECVPGGGPVFIILKQTAQGLRIRICNRLSPGHTPRERHGLGIALKNIRSRMERYFPGAVVLQTHARESWHRTDLRIIRRWS